MSDEIRQRMENVLSRIIGSLDAVHEKACFSMELSHDAEQFWNSENELWMQELRNWEELWKIEEWGRRIGEHALRIAGILHLAEYSNPETSPIDESEIRLAFNILDIFLITCRYVLVVRLMSVNKPVHAMLPYGFWSTTWKRSLQLN